MRQHLTRPPAIGLGVAAALALGIACGLEGVARLDDGSEKPGKLEKPGKPERKPNRLAREKSPYLLQHAHNPVDWFPWGPEAFEKARREGKPVFLSIGYSTCHWCHVMERESFEDERIAVYLNERFVAIKVDREERPDVDAVYMAACQAQTGSGGWPLSAFLTPEGKPFFTGTYFPPEDDPRRGPGFLSILGRVADAWKEDRARLEEGAEALARHLRAQAEALKAGLPLKGAVLRAGFEAFRDSHDDARGGFGGPPRFAPKFPRTVALDFLMAYASTKAAREDGTAAVAERMVQGTLDAMLRGGIRDHLAGGFHRYSTDRRWLVPHFEKMLYDQALIARTLAHAWRRTRKEPYRAAARETLDYVLARLAGPEGELYSAEDADTEGAEGKTYVWRRTEVLDLLGKDRGERFAELYGASEEGNFEEGGAGANVLHLALEGGAAELARRRGLSPEQLERELAEDRAALLAARDRRPQPFRDDKVLAEWNGLAVSALAHAFQVTGEARYLDAARRAARFVLERMTRDGRLQRRWRQGEAAIDAFLEDHAAVAEGLLDLYEADFDPRWLEAASRLAKEMLRSFWDAAGGGFLSSAKHHEALIAPTKDLYDGAVPSGSAIALLVLLRLEALAGDGEVKGTVRAFERVAAPFLERSPESHPYLLIGAAFLLEGAREIVIAGPAQDPVTAAMVREVHQRFLPFKVLLRVESAEDAARLAKLVPLAEGKSPIGGKPTAFVCRGGVCKLPARDVEALRGQLGGE